MIEIIKTCSSCIHNKESRDVNGSPCYLCRRNPTDNRTDWFEEKRQTKFNVDDLVSVQVETLGPFGQRIKAGTVGVVTEVWYLEDRNIYVVNFAEVYNVAFEELNLTLVKAAED